jgi:putative copper resistance protein D
MQLMALSSIGLLITLSVLATEVKGKITNVKLAVRSKKFLFFWLLSLFLFIIVQISYLLEQPLRNSLNQRYCVPT